MRTWKTKKGGGGTSDLTSWHVPVILDGRSALVIFVLLVVLIFIYRRLKRGAANALYSQGGPKTDYARPNDPPAERERWPPMPSTASGWPDRSMSFSTCPPRLHRGPEALGRQHARTAAVQPRRPRPPRFAPRNAPAPDALYSELVAAALAEAATESAAASTDRSQPGTLRR